MRSPKAEGVPTVKEEEAQTHYMSESFVRWNDPLTASWRARARAAPGCAPAPAMAQDGRLVAHLHRIPALVDLIDEDWRHEHLSHDDFDLPSVDFDEESDDVRTQPKRKAEEKWAELCLDEFQ